MNNQEINPELQRYLELKEKELESERIRRMNYENELNQSTAFGPIKDQNLIEYQLELKELLENIYHLLSGHIVTTDENGNEKWVEPEDDRLKILSDYGVKQLMNIIQFYINKNTLLSFYDAETINWKVRDFGIELTDLFLNRYEYFFYYPSPEELYEKYLPIIKLRKLDIAERELYMKCIQWSENELKSKIRHLPMIIMALVDSVHTTFLRALQGIERRTMRERINVSQNVNPGQDPYQSYIPQQKKSFFSPKTW